MTNLHVILGGLGEVFLENLLDLMDAQGVLLVFYPCSNKKPQKGSGHPRQLRTGCAIQLLPISGSFFPPPLSAQNPLTLPGPGHPSEGPHHKFPDFHAKEGAGAAQQSPAPPG